MYSSTFQTHPPALTPTCNHAFTKGKHTMLPNTYLPIQKLQLFKELCVCAGTLRKHSPTCTG